MYRDIVTTASFKLDPNDGSFTKIPWYLKKEHQDINLTVSSRSKVANRFNLAESCSSSQAWPVLPSSKEMSHSSQIEPEISVSYHYIESEFL